MTNPALHDPAFARKKEMMGDEDENANKGKAEQFNNHRLMTPRMRKIMNNKDAREMLQEEVQESMLRLKKAKFGHRLVDIVPDHNNKFYLPDKQSYFPKE